MQKHLIIDGVVKTLDLVGMTDEHSNLLGTDENPMVTKIEGGTITASVQGPIEVFGTMTAEIPGVVAVTGNTTVTGEVNATIVNPLPLPVTGTVGVTGTVATNATIVNAAPIPVSGTVTANVSGTVEIANDVGNPLPVSGSVNVNNFPANQTVSGSVGISGAVAVNNFPASVEVSNDVGNPLPVAVNNFPTTQVVSGTVAVNNFPTTQAVSGAVSVNNFPASVEVSNDVGSPLSVSGSVTATIPAGVAVTNTVSVTGTVNANVLGTVEIANDVGNAIPVTGTVVVSNFPSTQAVSGSVAVSNFPASVEVSNDAGNPLPVSGSVNATIVGPSPLPISGTVTASTLNDFIGTDDTGTVFLYRYTSTGGFPYTAYTFPAGVLYVIGNNPRPLMENPNTYQKFGPTAISALALTTIAAIPCQNQENMNVEIALTGAALSAFQILARCHPLGTYRLVASSNSDYTSVKSPLLSSSGALNALLVGSGYFSLDVTGFESVQLKAQSLTAASATVYAGMQ